MELHEIAMAVGAQVFTAGAIYGALRADIRNLHARDERIERSTDHAHERIDKLLLNPTRKD